MVACSLLCVSLYHVFFVTTCKSRSLVCKRRTECSVPPAKTCSLSRTSPATASNAITPETIAPHLLYARIPNGFSPTANCEIDMRPFHKPPRLSRRRHCFRSTFDKISSRRLDLSPARPMLVEFCDDGHPKSNCTDEASILYGPRLS